jgi:hypothetical protein
MQANESISAAQMDSLIADLNVYIQDASQLLSEGEYVELLELENRVKDICDRMHHMPVGSTKHYAKPLEDIKAKLDLLQEAMHDHKDQLNGDIQGLSMQKRASHAYAKISTMNSTEE